MVSCTMRTLPLLVHAGMMIEESCKAALPQNVWSHDAMTMEGLSCRSGSFSDVKEDGMPDALDVDTVLEQCQNSLTKTHLLTYLTVQSCHQSYRSHF